MQVIHGDCLDVLAGMADASFDAVVTDPPYSLSFMGANWDTHEGREDAALGYYLAGLTDGEGTFIIKAHARGTHALCFAIKLRADDEAILRTLKRFVGFGTLTTVPNRDGHPQVRWAVQDRAGCQRLVDLFDKYPLRAKKRQDYEVWREAVVEWTGRPRGNRWHGGADNAPMAALRDRIQGIRAYVDPPWSGHDFQDWCRRWGAECLRVLKPGGHLLAFGGTRTYHRLACGLEDAGFELRDSIIAWCFASGFPKSRDISKALEKAAGVEREVVGTKLGQPGYSLTDGNGDHRTYGRGLGNTGSGEAECAITAPATELAQRFDGYGTALKPSFEPVVVARKPLIGTVAQNVERWGVGGINVDGCRVESGPPRTTHANGHRSTGSGDGYGMGAYEAEVPAGRWPTNLLLCHSPNCQEGRCVEDCHVAEMDRQSGTRRSAGNYPSSSDTSGIFVDLKQGQLYGDSGGASRFYPCFRFEAKADSSERMAGPDGTKHVTVKPVDLMRWLVRLVSPPGGGLILDPFAGSGSTLVAAFLEDVECVGIEKDARYVPIIEKRLEQAKSRGAQTSLFG